MVPAASLPVVPTVEPKAQPPITGTDIEDLIHLQGPLTEDAVMKCLQARFNASHFYVSNQEETRQRLLKKCLELRLEECYFRPEERIVLKLELFFGPDET